jgi:5-oxoprolinase (ATP-hydrolysing)
MTDQSKFRFAIDRGGTFTDIYAEIPGKPGFMVVKLLSEDPHNYPDAPREGIRRVLEAVNRTPVAEEAFDASGIEWIRMGTTLATNALLERKGARCALVVTKGFGDILRIGNQSRPHIFDLEIRKPDLLYECVIEANERLRILRPDESPPEQSVVEGRTGDRLVVLKSLDTEDLRKRLQAVYDQGVRSLAVALMHAYAWPDHERAVGRLARAIGFTQVSLSHRVMPRVKLVPRADTTMVDAYLTPCIRNYLSRFRKGFRKGLQGTGLLFMQSDGGLAGAEEFTGSRALLSGPAGGVVGYAMTAYQAQSGRPVIGFDMGGTSTDVSRYAGAYELVFETETAGVRIQAPQLQIKTVAAGGGSRLFFENGMFMVGPDSAGAHPGPVCYRKQGDLTVTDANLVLGRIQPEYFPKLFGATEDQALDLKASQDAMARLTDQINLFNSAKGREPLTVEQVALGFIQVANEMMVRPIREISVLRGYDIKEHVLAAFGGAGPQHACAIARGLGISKIYIHRFSGILSAYGMGLADVVVERQKPFSWVLAEDIMAAVELEIDALQTEAYAQLKRQGFESDALESAAFLNLRYQGTDTAMMIPRMDLADYKSALSQAYQREFGFDLAGRDILIDDIRVRARGTSPRLNPIPIAPAKAEAPIRDTVSCFFGQGWHDTRLYNLDDLGAGDGVEGPAIIIHDTSTIVLEPDCRALVTPYGDVEITVGSGQYRPIGTTVDPVQLSIFSNLFISVAEQMGRMLQKTAISTNIKERLDFSCALFGPDGELVANAPHLPVHLGAMSEAVKEQMRRRAGNLKPGDVLVSNHPVAGGSHLPDITVITPVFRQERIIFWVAARGHHADIGGILPGSMPPNSRRIEEEGAGIISFKLVRDGLFQEQGITRLLRAPGETTSTPGAPPISGTRQLEENISDLKAQVAANQMGIELLLEMVDHYGLDGVQAYMGHVQEAAEAAVREHLKALSFDKAMAEVETVHAVDHMDDGSAIALALTIDRRDGSAIFDFTGTGPQTWGNCNAPKAVTQSAILYCLRCLIKKELPLNYGCLIPITIKIPKGSLLDPSPDAAVVGGNVLTSQRITDVVLKAFGVAAASQGCMNNFTFGNQHFGYYETIGGGAGAGPTWHGQTGVHTHMTNTRITDPEILELRYPLLLRQFAVRNNSGGRGKFNGGDGLVREVEFLESVHAGILSERRVFAPYGLEGGQAGARGINLLIRRDGRNISLGAKNEFVAKPGERLRILTPGGGGFGTPE